MAKSMEEITAQIIKLLYESGANQWSVQDKGILLAAIKQQLAEKETKAR